MTRRKPNTLSLPWRQPLDVFANFADKPYSVLLLGDGSRNNGRWSYIVTDPIDTITLSDVAYRHDPMEQVEKLLTAHAPNTPSGNLLQDLPPFTGGVVGLASYEMAKAYERLDLPLDPQNWPVLTAGVYDQVIAFDHWHERSTLISWRDVSGANALAQAYQYELPPQQGRGHLTPIQPDHYPQNVAGVVNDIRAGEMFQANISRAWQGHVDGNPYTVFQNLAQRHPSPMGGYMRLVDHVLMTNSPERFLRVFEGHAERVIQSQPIKGTCPRGLTEAEDEALGKALETSPKDIAENYMIVDLVRNDLAQWSRPGTVRVAKCAERIKYAHVQHLVSTVEAKLKPKVRPSTAFAGAFPAGSITGAPKIRAMQAIAQYEQVGRGAYCGSLFWYGFDGAFDSNVLIRSMMCKRDVDGSWDAIMRAGGGITAQSNPMAEFQETETKARGVLSVMT